MLRNDGCVVSTVCCKMMAVHRVLCLQCVVYDGCVVCVVSTVCCI